MGLHQMVDDRILGLELLIADLALGRHREVVMFNLNVSSIMGSVVERLGAEMAQEILAFLMNDRHVVLQGLVAGELGVADGALVRLGRQRRLLPVLPPPVPGDLILAAVALPTLFTRL